MTIEKVKLIVVRKTAPDVEVQLGFFRQRTRLCPSLES
jgi:hypothetical protein